MKSQNPERLIFQDDRNKHVEAMGYARSMLPMDRVHDKRGWILFGPQDVRQREHRWQFCLQKLPGQKTPRVRVGCRYFTLAQAWRHWGAKPKRWITTSRRNERAQAVAIIRLMLLQAQAYGLLSMYSATPKFDSTIIKPKRK